MNNKIILFIGVVCLTALIYSLITFSIQGEIKYKYPNGFYCIPQQGIYYFESNQVPQGAILVKQNPDITQGEYTNRLNLNFFKMMGCAK